MKKTLSINVLTILLLISTSCGITHKYAQSDVSDNGLQLKKEKTKYYPLDGKSNADNSVESMIKPYRDSLSKEMDVVIGEAMMDMEKAKPESTLGNWVADAIWDRGKAYSAKEVDFCVVNHGGVRIPSLPKGDVSVGKIYELMPFDNMLTVVELDGNTTMQFMQHISNNGGWPISKGVALKMTKEGILLKATINGQKIDRNRTYRIVMSDYIANGGDKCSFLIGQPREELGVFFRDGLIDYVKTQTEQNNKLQSSIEGRVTYE